MNGKIIILLVGLFVLISGCTQSQQQILLLTAIDRMNGASDFETTAEQVQLINGVPYVSNDPNYLFAGQEKISMHLKFKAPDKIYAECVSPKCLFSMKVGDKAIVNGENTYLFKAREGTYSLCAPNNDLAKFVGQGIQMKSSIAQFLRVAINALVLRYDGTEQVEGETAHKIAFDYATRADTDYSNYIYIRERDFMPIKYSSISVSRMPGNVETLRIERATIGKNLTINTGIRDDAFNPTVAFASAREVQGLCG